MDESRYRVARNARVRRKTGEGFQEGPLALIRLSCPVGNTAYVHVGASSSTFPLTLTNRFPVDSKKNAQSDGEGVTTMQGDNQQGWIPQL